MDITRCQLAFGLQPSDRLVLIKEQHLADANFVLSYLLRQILDEGNQVLLVLTHNSLAHYNCVAKRLGYSLMQNVGKRVHIIDFQAMILASLDSAGQKHDEGDCDLLQQLIVEIRNTAGNCIGQAKSGKCFIVVDEIAHIYDYCSHIGDSINFLNCFLGLHFNDANVCYILSMHLASAQDNVLSRDLEYSASCVVDVSLLKSGRSSDVSGIMRILRNRKVSVYHYKTRENGVDLYRPGEMLFR